MNTTDIFIEHLIAGVQVGVWVLLIFLSIFGYKWIDMNQIQNLQFMLAVILLPFIYPLGIVVDNIADEILQPQRKRIRDRYINNREHTTARLNLRMNNEQITAHLDYIRRKIRISRSTFLNMIIITVSLVFFTISRLQEQLGNDLPKAILFELILGVVFIYLSWNAWADFTTTQYKRVEEYYSELEKQVN